MKLTELSGPSKSSKQISKVFESYFGSRISFNTMNRQQARQMLSSVRSLIREHRQKPNFHQSEHNPAYLKLIMLEQGLTGKLREENPNATLAPTQATPGQAAQNTAAAIATTKDPKLKMALGKTAKGGTLTPDEQKLVAGAALAKTESRLRHTRGYLRESEIQQAQVVLATQDMVDRVQKMLEDVSSMQFKDLPALVAQIKNEVGTDQSMQFNNDATAALTALMQNLQTSKQQLESALGVVTGEGSTMPGADDADLGLGTDDLGADIGGDDLGLDDDAGMTDLDADIDMDSELGIPAASLGRARR